MSFRINGNIDNENMYMALNDGSTWQKVFEHITVKPDGTANPFTSVAEARSCNTYGKYSILGNLSGFIGTDSKYELMIRWPIELPGKYIRWKQTNIPENEYNVTSGVGSTVTGFELIHNDLFTGKEGQSSSYFGGLQRTNSNVSTVTNSYLNGNFGQAIWYYSVGVYNLWAFPSGGAGSSVAKAAPLNDSDINATFCIQVWVRVDTCSDKTKYVSPANICSNASGSSFSEKLNGIAGSSILTAITDSSKWVKVASQNVTSGNNLFFNHSDAERSTFSPNALGILDQLANYRSTDGYYEFLYVAPIGGTAYHRWKQTNLPENALRYSWSGSAWTCKTSNPVTGFVNIAGTTDKYWGSSAGMSKLNSAGEISKSSTYISGVYTTAFSNWWNAVNEMAMHQNGIPGINGVVTTTAALYIRCDNTEMAGSTKMKILKDTNNTAVLELIEEEA